MLFSRNTIIEIISLLEKYSHAEIDRILIRFNIENIAPQNLNSKYKRANDVMTYLINNPERRTDSGGFLVYELLEYVLKEMLERDSYRFEENYPEIINSLKLDGFVIENNDLVRITPEVYQPVISQSELMRLLDTYQLDIPKGHLEQALDSHKRGQWASSNAQLRTFIESFFDEIVKLVSPPHHTLPQTSHQRREYLVNIDPPFLLIQLNEWEIGSNGGFIQGFWRRLHPSGSHPGLSDESDCTFRLQLVLLVSHHIITRLRERIG